MRLFLERPQLAFAVIGLLSLLTGLPMAGRRVPPNRWYGVRIRATFADAHVWYEANAQAGRELALLGVVVLALALGGDEWLTPVAHAALCGAVLSAGTVVVLARSVRLANRLWRERGGKGRGAGAVPGDARENW